MSSEHFWQSPVVQALVDARDLGGVIRMAREHQGWRQADLGQAVGYSRSTISRLETSAATRDLVKARVVANRLEIPAEVFAQLVGIGQCPAVTVVASVAAAPEDDPMHRRSLLAAAGLAVPMSALLQVDDALAVLPEVQGAATPQRIASLLTRARRRWDTGDLSALVRSLPELLAAAHQAAEQSDDRAGYVLVASAYDLAAEALNKIGMGPQSRITADRATLFAARSEDVLAQAAAARTLGVVLRHEDRPRIAEQVTLQAAERIHAAGLPTPEHAAAYAQMLCTSAYNTAQAGDNRALDMIQDARAAARSLPQGTPALGRRTRIDSPQVALYEVSVHWALGDPEKALAVGHELKPAMFATPERRARLHTDMARAWWLRGRPEQTAQRLLAASREAAGEVRDRPAIRAMAQQVVARHGRVAGARELTALLRRR
ncbi:MULTISPECIES: helix-turn-helix transcriptional regulator [Thermomonosporaceae]|uniref:helix-turn-helix transcriptional regulator n=1 Tax=Thermomonosporaceae TaxID=2012 RepID=UPI00255AEAC4|nr:MULTISPECIES: helix-turn-helix transcriptional regulator [Thermomonosporaceae]MDL4774240.1 helix-turn-helix transcriptional regulator [Actinomadura xylanilytica]